MNRLNTWAAGVVAALIHPAPTRTERSSLPPASESGPPSIPLDLPPTGVNPRYGPYDPVHDAKRFIWPCPCGKRPVLNSVPEVRSRRLPARHQIDCKACGRKGPPGATPWEAVVGWDRAFPDVRLPMGIFPFFELRGLSTREARRKLLGVRAELETWRAAARRSSSTQDVRRDDSDRIDAYLRWTIVAQALAAAHLQLDQSEAARRIANRLAQNAPTAPTQEP